MIQVNRQSKILFWVLFFVLCAAVALTYYRVDRRDYYVISPAEDVK